MAAARRITVNGETFDVEVVSLTAGEAVFGVRGRTYVVREERSVTETSEQKASSAPKRQASSKGLAPTPAGPGAAAAPMPGVVVEVLVQPGDKVSSGDILVRLEAMKMQNNILSPKTGVVQSVAVSAGEEVRDGQVLVVID